MRTIGLALILLPIFGIGIGSTYQVMTRENKPCVLKVRERTKTEKARCFESCYYECRNCHNPIWECEVNGIARHALSGGKVAE